MQKKSELSLGAYSGEVPVPGSKAGIEAHLLNPRTSDIHNTSVDSYQTSAYRQLNKSNISQHLDTSNDALNKWGSSEEGKVPRNMSIAKLMTKAEDAQLS